MALGFSLLLVYAFLLLASDVEVTVQVVIIWHLNIIKITIFSRGPKSFITASDSYKFTLQPKVCAKFHLITNSN